MTAYSLVVLAGTFVTAWLLAFVAFRSRSRPIRWAFAAEAVASLVAAGTYYGLSEGVGDAGWAGALRASYVFSHALVPVLVLAVVPGRIVHRARPAVFGLLAIAPALAFAPPLSDWQARLGYQATPLGAYLGLCLVLAFSLSLVVWLSTSLVSSEAFWLIVATFLPLDAGPLFAAELEVTGFQDPGAVNLAMPLSLAAFALFALRTNPLPMPSGRSRRAAPLPPSGRPRFLVVDEERPKYLERLAQQEAGLGRAVLILERGKFASVPSAGPLARAEIRPTPRAALLAWTTALEFFRRHERGLFVVKDLGAIAALSGWSRTVDLVRELRRISLLRRGPSVALATTCLRVEERDELRRLGATWWRLPNPSREVETILAHFVGPVADSLLDAFSRSHAVPRRQLGVEHIPALAAFLRTEVRELTTGLSDAKGEDGMAAGISEVIDALIRFRTRTLEALARGDWPSRSVPAAPESGVLVTADRYWRGEEPVASIAWPRRTPHRRSAYALARSLFVRHLGPEGESLLLAELSSLGRGSQALEPEDFGRLSDRASADLTFLADAIDLPAPRNRLKRDIESLCRSLAGAQVG